MNIAALNFKNDCLSNAVSDPALLHAILYIVATDYDLHQGVFDSALTVHHGGEAIRLVNKQLNSGDLTDTLAAAVAIIATREASIHHTDIKSFTNLCRISMVDFKYRVSI